MQTSMDEIIAGMDILSDMPSSTSPPLPQLELVKNDGDLGDKTSVKIEPKEYLDNCLGGEIDPDPSSSSESEGQPTIRTRRTRTSAPTTTCANCNTTLTPGKLEKSKNFHEFISLDDDGATDIEVIDAISEIFQVHRTGELYEDIYKRNDLFLCVDCAKILTLMYELYQEFTSLAVKSEAFLQTIFAKKQIDDNPTLSDGDDDLSPSIDEDEAPPPRKSKRLSKQSANNNSHPCPKPDCPKSFSRKRQLQRHLNSHSSDPSTSSCDRCGKSFKTLGGLKIHYSSHLRDDAKFSCKVCAKKFRKSEALLMHEKTDHEGFKPHQCPQCEKTFRLKEKLKLHLMVIHEKRSPFPCPKCEKAFRTKYHLKIHDVTQHIQRGANGETSVGCSQCKRKFHDRDALEKHVLIHQQEKPFICVACGKGFQTSARLKLHEKSHQEVPSCLCPICGRAYKHARDLRLHEVVHQDESTYRFGCGDCPRRFYRIDLLRVHQSNEKHFSCEVVGPTMAKSAQTPPTLPAPPPPEEDEDDSDENETDTEVTPPPPPPARKKPKGMPLKHNPHHSQAIIYHPVVQLQSSATTNYSDSGPTLPLPASYFVSQSSSHRPNVIHHQIQTTASHNLHLAGTHAGSLYSTHHLNVPNLPQSTVEQMGLDFMNSFMG